MTRKFDPDWVISPGETLRDWMEENHLSARITAGICLLEPKDIEGILSGRRKITKDLAAHLARGTQISASLWLNLERAYRQGLAAGKKDVSQ